MGKQARVPTSLSAAVGSVIHVGTDIGVPSDRLTT